MHKSRLQNVADSAALAGAREYIDSQKYIVKDRADSGYAAQGEVIYICGKHVNFYIKTSISDLLDMYCDEVGQTKTEATERILKKFLDNHFMKKSLIYGESVNK